MVTQVVTILDSTKYSSYNRYGLLFIIDIESMTVNFLHIVVSKLYTLKIVVSN